MENNNKLKKPSDITAFIVGAVVIATLIKILFIWLFPPVKQPPVNVTPVELHPLSFPDLKPVKLQPK